MLQRAQRLQAQIRQTWLVVAVASAAVAGVGGYVLWIGALAVKAAIIILFVVAIALLGQLIMLLLARMALTQARVRLLKARLHTPQHVSTCMSVSGWIKPILPGRRTATRSRASRGTRRARHRAHGPGRPTARSRLTARPIGLSSNLKNFSMLPAAIR